MKCKYCGNNLGIEDAVCPFCGKKNDFASKHNKDMAEFKEDYDSTKKDVLQNSRIFNGFTARISIIAILIALIMATMIGFSNSYEIRSERASKIANADIEKHRARLEELCNSRNYLGLYYYYSINHLEYSDKLDDFDMISFASTDYHSTLYDLYHLFEYNDYEDVNEQIHDIAYFYDNICSLREPGSNYEREHSYNELTTPYVTDMCKHFETLLQAYFQLSDEDMKGFTDLDKARKALILEEGWNNVNKAK
ncbi:MAG: zinc ribbon domain-containing protein [Lachnospiraceae bacterium]|nr:zinc ribbon domain-containing protein [Lachnospiraceae bacterium]